MKMTGKLKRAIRQHTEGDLVHATGAYTRIHEQDPENPQALYFAALAAYQLKDLDRAIRLMCVVVDREPKHADAWYNLGKFLQDKGDDARALDFYLAALTHNPRMIVALTNAGNLYLAGGDEATALACYHQALAENPTSYEAVYNRSFLKLMQGDYESGWRDYEARWHCPAFTVEYGREFMPYVPAWDGSPLNGRTLLVHGEQGAGDQIMTARYFALLPEDGEVVIECAPSLVSLFHGTFGDNVFGVPVPGFRVIGRGDPLPRFDVHIPTMSLPRLLGTPGPTGLYLTTLRPLPVIPYVAPFTVGLCWAGSSTHPNDRNRSIPVQHLEPLAACPITMVSLQVGERADDADYLGVVRLDRIGDYADTAAAMLKLDLVITVDTSVAHLAGALGVPVWILLPSFPDYRWGLQHSTTVWYPTATLYRQEQKGDWTSVIERVRNDLEARVRA